MKPNQDPSKIKQKLRKSKIEDCRDDMIDCSTIIDYEVPLPPEELSQTIDSFQHGQGTTEYNADSEKSSSIFVRSQRPPAILPSSEFQISTRRSVDSFMGNQEKQSCQCYHIGNKEICWVCDASKSTLSVFSGLPPNNHQVVGANTQGSDVWSKFVALMGVALSKFFLVVLNVLGFLLDNPTPLFLLFGLFSFYFVLLYLELSLAALIELCARTVWPTSHIFLHGTERFFKLLSTFLGQLDDLGQAVYCDLAEQWCERFKMMCADKCSFVDMAVNKMR